jgi:hypothetical protein
MSVKIENIVHYQNFRKDGKRVPMLEVHYTTSKGFEGVVHLEEQGATKESITAAVLKVAALPESLIGAELGK